MDGLDALLAAAAQNGGAGGDPGLTNLAILQLLKDLRDDRRSKEKGPLDLPGDISVAFKPAQNVVHAAALRDFTLRNPKAAWERLEGNLKQAVGQGVLDKKSAAHFIKDNSLVGKTEWAGYVLSMLAGIHGAMAEDDWDRARYLTIASLMAVDLFLLEGNWAVGYKTLNLDPPPWTSWEGQQVKRLQALQATSRLLPPEWWSVFNLEARDEEQAMKRRSPQKGSGRGDGAGAGAGGGGH